ncbi:hypothetical protein ABEH87_16780 [Erwinia sp. Eh17-17]|uniref:glycoside hydrolase family 19 protein n=1 Tax=Erwinia sp. Eh17-17 TaxID=3080330 RepID=UPI003208AC61
MPKGPGGADLLSQYDLAKLGFKTEVSEPASFDYLNGKTQPAGLLRSVFQSLYDAAKDDTRVSHALAPSNYQRLLNRIDSGAGEYSPMDYLRALHNPAYREVVQKTIVKHPSDWYHSKSDSIWQRFLDPLKKEAPEWKKYSEAFLDKMTWMQDVTKEKLGRSLWHMHPVMFLGALKPIGYGVTYDQLKRIFPQASDEDLNTVVNDLRGKLETYKLNTPTRLRHFFSQIKGEVGPQMKGKTEGFQFSPDALRSFSRYYRQHSSEADQDGYAKNARGVIIRRADEQAIGRKHYLRLNGNRQTNPDDGYNFRGRGLIQITGYEKYNGFPTDYHKYWSDNAPDSVSNPDIINEMPYAIRSAIWYWLKYKPYSEDKGRGYEDVGDVTRIVNGGDMGLAERKIAYRLCEQVFL